MVCFLPARKLFSLVLIWTSSWVDRLKIKRLFEEERTPWASNGTDKTRDGNLAAETCPEGTQAFNNKRFLLAKNAKPDSSTRWASKATWLVAPKKSKLGQTAEDFLSGITTRIPPCPHEQESQDSAVMGRAKMASYEPRRSWTARWNGRKGIVELWSDWANGVQWGENQRCSSQRWTNSWLCRKSLLIDLVY